MLEMSFIVPYMGFLELGAYVKSRSMVGMYG